MNKKCKRKEYAINKITVKSAFITSLPVMAGYIVLGAGFGVLLSAKGYSFWWAILMSVTMFAGTGQYIGVNILASGASVISAALITLMVNARHIFYGVSMIENYRGMGWRKWYAAFGLTDETYSLLCLNPELPEGANRSNFNFLVTLMNHIYWIFGGFLGAIIGSAIAFNSAGIDFSMTALFVSIFVEQWEKTKLHLPAIWGFVISLICLIIFGADSFLIPAMIGICAGLFIMRGKIEKGSDKARTAKEDKND
ncbi:MAG: AzlC family ABC transporter permease [Oscillospiraceae bacterium]|nr:AzlC family ABC transporter permease [Oscillospiraceae bacterium]